MASRKQIAASRRNGRLGGPKTPEGKAVSRLNARKHGIFASALTPLDHEELRGVHDRCRAELRPVGFLEEAVVEKIALMYLRLQRCARAEAEYHVLTWTAHPSQENLLLADPASLFDRGHFETTVTLVQRYDTTLTNQFLKLIHELQALQDRRSCEQEATEQHHPAQLRNKPDPSDTPFSQGDTPSPAGDVPPCARAASPAPDEASPAVAAGGLHEEPDPAAVASPGTPAAALQNEPNPSQAPASQDDTEEPLDAPGLTGRRPEGNGAASRDPFQPHPRLPYWHRRGHAPDAHRARSGR
jgi:hypothetical protein